MNYNFLQGGRLENQQVNPEKARNDATVSILIII